jgi:hypothetical protein
MLTALESCTRLAIVFQGLVRPPVEGFIRLTEEEEAQRFDGISDKMFGFMDDPPSDDSVKSG